MKTLIIPDLHLQWQTAEKIINYVGADKIVFLGDYFDNWNDDASINLIMAQWLLDSLSKPDRIHLLGNHDISYAVPLQEYKCSGYDIHKDYAINSVLKEEDWKKLKLFTWVGDYLCSHAGVHPHFYKSYNPSGLDFKSWLENIAESSMKDVWDLKPQPPLLQAGYSRGGDAKRGGILWCDRTEFYGVDGINQIFGHTPVKRPVWMEYNTPNTLEYSINLALDVSHAAYYAIYDDITKKVTVKWVGDM